MRRDILAFCLIGAGVLVSVLTEYGWLPDPEPDARSGGPPEFLLGALFAIIAFLLPRAKPQTGLNRPVRIWRRAVAGYVDALTAVFMIFAVIGLLEMGLAGMSPTTADALARERDQPVKVALESALVSVVFVSLCCYFWLHAKWGRATLGQYIMGYRIENDPDPNIPPHHFVRTIFAMFAACSWHLWGWFVKAEDTLKGNYWWDRIGQTRAVFVGPY